MECEASSKNIGKCNDRIRDDEINRVNILSLPRGREMVYITSDDTKFYAHTHFGMVGEGVIEVGWSSVNGAIGEGFNQSCIDYVREHIRSQVADNPDLTLCVDSPSALTMLWRLVYEANRAYNIWLGEHQGEY